MTRTADAVGMSEANAPISAVQSGAVAWRYGSRQHFGGWLYQDGEPTDDQKADPYIRWEPLFAAPQSEPLPGGVGERIDAAINSLADDETLAELSPQARMTFALRFRRTILAALSGKEQG